MEPNSDDLVNQGQLLISVTSHPGFYIIKAILEEMCQETAETLIKFDGWEPGAIQALQARAKVAYEIRDELYSRVRRRIEIAEQQQLYNLQSQSVSSTTENSDDLREKALKLFEKIYPKQE